MGPSLNVNGTLVPGHLADPTLELYDGNGALVTSNDNWKDSPQRAEIEASGLAPNNEKESAILRTLAPGAYTGVLRGKDNSTGIALVEAYDLATGNSIIANISSRGFVERGDNVMIGGFIVGNQSGSTKILLRAIGPSLTKSGVPNALHDPILELHDSNGSTLANNDNWKDTQQAEIEATGIPPNDDRESAIVRTLTPGAYTAILSGKNDTIGVALVEAYNVQ
jgi:hypothetical protein